MNVGKDGTAVKAKHTPSFTPEQDSAARQAGLTDKPVRIVVAGTGLEPLADHLRRHGYTVRLNPKVSALLVNSRDVLVWVLGVPAPSDRTQLAALLAITNAVPLVEVIVLLDKPSDVETRCWWAEHGAAVVIEGPWLPREVLAWVRNRTQRQAWRLREEVTRRLSRQARPGRSDEPPPAS